MKEREKYRFFFSGDIKHKAKRYGLWKHNPYEDIKDMVLRYHDGSIGECVVIAGFIKIKYRKTKTIYFVEDVEVLDFNWKEKP